MNKDKNYIEDIKLLAHTLTNVGAVLRISDAIFYDLTEFGYWSGAAKPEHHHYGDYGLGRHTYEVINLMLTCKSVLQLNIPSDHIFLAGLFHDIGKLWDYKRKSPFSEKDSPKNPFNSNAWEGTLHKREIHHISRSGLLWSKAVDKYRFYQDDHDDILHAILSHHGQREWGSPVAPHTKLAWLLHTCDQISARMDDCDRHDIVTER